MYEIKRIFTYVVHRLYVSGSECHCISNFLAFLQTYTQTANRQELYRCTTNFPKSNECVQTFIESFEMESKQRKMCRNIEPSKDLFTYFQFQLQSSSLQNSTHFFFAFSLLFSLSLRFISCISPQAQAA